MKRSGLEHLDRPSRIVHHLESALSGPGGDRQRPARVGQLDATARALEQAQSECPFEVVDLLRDRALCQVQGRGGAGDMLVLGDGQERAELLDREGGLRDPHILARLMYPITSHHSTNG